MNPLGPFVYLDFTKGVVRSVEGDTMRAALGSSGRGVIVALFLVPLPGDAIADTLIIGSRGAIGSAYLGAAAGNALASGIELARTKAQANAQFAAARRRFFAEYPNGKDFAPADTEFADLLWQKDLYFLWVSLPTGFRDSSPNSMASVLGNVDALTGGTLDGGIPSAAAFRFDRWVTAVRGHLGAESYRAPLRRLPSASQFAAALDATRDQYAQYRRDRDEAELEMQCRARPGPYCAASSGSYSHGGNTGRAARIADHYLANYAQTLPGGGAMKATLRDAIIKYESLSYTTQDCIRTMDRLLQGESRRDPNMAVLRSAIVRYESAKIMSQEDICIRAAQDMQRDEARRNGTPSAEPAPKESWDITFRTSKFNELHGSITTEQAAELARARGGRQDPSRITATVIDFYTGGPAARAAKVRPYLYVRDKIIRTARPGSAAPTASKETKQGSDPRAGDRERARALFEKACDDGDAGGCYQAAFMAGTGQGGPLDQGRARAFYERACTGGDARGCVNLGYFFSAGIGGPQDLVRARGLYEQACKAGIRSSCSRRRRYPGG